MDSEQLEKQLQIWNRFMYIAIGASATLLLISLGHYMNGSRWPDFEYYAGGMWQWMQLAATPPGFYLLWGKQWKTLPFLERRSTVIGFFVASWITFLSLGFITTNESLIDLTAFLTLCAVLIAFGYGWMLKKKSNRSDEMFP